MSYKIIFILITFLLVNACSYVPKLDQVIPDRRTEYKKSETLPDLEVPPDLTADAQQDALDIPDEQATTMSEFERRKNSRSGADIDTSKVDPLSGEQWLVVKGSAAEIWPRLREFWTKKGFAIDLDDVELGVFETKWLETNNKGISEIRDKFRLFTESGGTPDTTILYLSNERQERTASESGNTAWIDIEKDPEYEKQIISDLNLYFYGDNAPAGTSSLTASESTRPTTAAIAEATRPKAEMLDLGKDKVYLALPDEFTMAWKLAEQAITKAGMFIENNDRSKGLYYILYYEQQKEDKSLLSKLKFWGNKEPKGKEYQISLTGVGDKTELVVLDDKGEWIPKDDATKILTYIRAQYNIASR